MKTRLSAFMINDFFRNNNDTLKKINFQPTFLQILYLIIFSIIFSFVIYTPTLIKGPAQLTAKLILKEETIEGSLFCILFIMSILILYLYKQEIDKHKELIDKISNDQKIFVQAIINEITKLFVILNSLYYKKGNKIFAEVIPDNK